MRDDDDRSHDSRSTSSLAKGTVRRFLDFLDTLEIVWFGILMLLALSAGAFWLYTQIRA